MINKTHSKQRRRTGSTTRRRTATTGSVPPQCLKVDSHWERQFNSRSRAQNFGSQLERFGSNVRHRLGTFADGGQRKRTFPSVSHRFIHLF